MGEPSVDSAQAKSLYALSFEESHQSLWIPLMLKDAFSISVDGQQLFPLLTITTPLPTDGSSTSKLPSLNQRVYNDQSVSIGLLTRPESLADPAGYQLQDRKQ